MVLFYHGQTGRNGSVQNDQPNQPTVPTGPRIALAVLLLPRANQQSDWLVRSGLTE